MSKFSYPKLSLALGACALGGFGLWKFAISNVASSPTIEKTTSASVLSNNPCALALVRHEGSEKVDREIRRLQDEARVARKRSDTIKRLGWAFVSKARLSYDPGFYKLAEQCSI